MSLSNCKQTKNESARQGFSKSSIENFDSFYDRFHKDSLFQISRLKFPLGGGLNNGNIDEQWTKENWSMLKTKIFDVDTTQYKVFYEKLEKSFKEKVWLENSGFSFECRYELINKCSSVIVPVIICHFNCKPIEKPLSKVSAV